MTNIEAARQNARTGVELGDLRGRLNVAATQGRYARHRAEVETYSAAYKNALLAGDGEAAAAALAMGRRLINEYYGVEL